MTVSPQPQTTPCSMPTDGRFQSGSLHSKWTDPASLLARLRALPLGALTITGSEIIPGRYRMVETTCQSCGIVRRLHVDNMLAGKTTQCRCLRGVKNRSTRRSSMADPLRVVIACRYDAIKQRCTNPNSPVWRGYGGRGIQCRFPSRQDFIEWVIENLPHPTYRGVQIDRINNEGHYEPGNIRLVSQQENLRNTRRSRLIDVWGQRINLCQLKEIILMRYPTYFMSTGHTQVLWRKGLKIEQIIQMGMRMSTIS